MRGRKLIWPPRELSHHNRPKVPSAAVTTSSRAHRRASPAKRLLINVTRVCPETRLKGSSLRARDLRLSGACCPNRCCARASTPRAPRAQERLKMLRFLKVFGDAHGVLALPAGVAVI